MNAKGLRILKLLQNRQMTRKEIAEALHEDISAVNDLVELLHTNFQYIKLSIVNDGDIISTEPPAPKYSITPSGQAYLLSVYQTLGSQLFYALATAVTLFCFAGVVKSFQKYHMKNVNDPCRCKCCMNADQHRQER